ncbi:hypothetical protein JDV02_005691 [Purpureocillium takamizusanense]|uniref:3CxxC-type domain-containing protein n=1 Tax=Purpureocillium takamizusanense TaxID=2060973 RepID=A0A9Q8QET5_9HYPO|nr:uncharacterized protein JDV02_005691 [Purpureocillium takamizusanense]UNI19509.1 hypothetical protein JDV02_005691 [Purpureocillium takamizusanense]
MVTKRGTKKAPKPWALYPSLHEQVTRLLEEDDLFFDFNHADDDVSCIRDYDTTIMGHFACRNASCKSDGWSSKKIAITIRMYPGARYNARVYFQRCKSCKKLSRPSLDDSYADRVAYRLKKWCGVHVAQPYRSGQSKGPHQSELCEGCKAGHCSEMSQADF